ncbi:MAG: glycerophosphodiester phosphodiesterase family protein [Micromonosporaceae bacterium]
MAHRYPYLDAPRPIAFAHRGGAAPGDENSMAAFARSVEAGYRYLETDVHSSSDGVPVVFHDGDLSRMFGRPGRVDELSWADLASLRRNGESLLPRLEDVLDAWPQCRFNIDMKADSAVGPTLAAVARLTARDRVLLASFDDRRIRWVRHACGPRQATSLGRRETAALRLGSLHPRRLPGRRLGGFVPGVAAAQVPVRFRGVRVVDARFVRHAHRLGLQVHVWTIDDPTEMHELLDLDVDGIMTDHIEVLREVLTARGQWAA